MERDGVFPVVDAGVYPAELVEVCRLWNVGPGELLAWSVRKDGVTIVLPGGQKVGAGVRGEWAPRMAAPSTAADPAPSRRPTAEKKK